MFNLHIYLSFSYCGWRDNFVHMRVDMLNPSFNRFWPGSCLVRVCLFVVRCYLQHSACS